MIREINLEKWLPFTHKVLHISGELKSTRKHSVQKVARRKTEYSAYLVHSVLLSLLSFLIPREREGNEMNISINIKQV
jgi:hypothetical protein